MKKNKLYQFFLIFLLTVQYGYSQVDVVYSNLVWSDEFNTNGPVDSTNWFQQTQLPNGVSWNNGEVQHYTNLLSNSYVDSGSLKIVAIKQNYTDQGVTKEYTSARLNSKFAFKYGRVDVRAKVPVLDGTWPAIWMLGKNINETGAYFASNYGTTSWPACGEIDIMEHGIFQSQPVNYIQGTLHTPSSFGNSINNGGIIASTDLQNNYHVYSMNWSPFQISFLLDDVVYYTYNPIIKDTSTWPFNEDQFLLLNVAMGGVAGNIPSNFTQASMDIDYVRVYQNTLVDTQAPTNFTATVGTVTGSTIELLLNSNDNSGNVVYTINYGSNSVSFANPAGIQKSVIIPNLTANTLYTFTVSATDLSGNAYVNNPIILNATTASTLSCSGTDTQATQGSFSIGYNYTFETIGSDVKITFEMLDTDKVGVVAYLWRQSPFSETHMSNVTGNIFTKTITSQTLGSTISYGVKFAYSGGLSVTKYVSYVVGSNCTFGTVKPTELSSFTFQNPANEYLHIYSDIKIDKVEIYNTLGVLVKAETENTKEVAINNLSKGIYLVTVYSDSQKSVKKLIVE